MTRYCPVCGAACARTDILCPSCGRLLGETVLPAQYPQPAVYRPVAGTNGLAVASMVFGIISLAAGINGLAVTFMIFGAIILCITCTFVVILSVLAVILGFISLSQIRSSLGKQQGKGMAVAGIVCGFAGIGLNVPLVVAMSVGPLFTYG